jgi:hypothetical protein
MHENDQNQEVTIFHRLKKARKNTMSVKKVIKAAIRMKI